MNVSRVLRWRAILSDREPICTEREPKRLLILTEREPKSTTVREPGRHGS